MDERPPRVVIIDSATDGSPSGVPRLSAELTYAGYDVVFDPPEASVKPLNDLARSVAELNAVAGVWLAPRSDVVWVSTLNPDGQEVLIREVSIVQDDPEFVAIRVVELVQASLEPANLARDRAPETEPADGSAAVPSVEGESPDDNRWRCALDQDGEGNASVRCEGMATIVAPGEASESSEAGEATEVEEASVEQMPAQDEIEEAPAVAPADDPLDAVAQGLAEAEAIGDEDADEIRPPRVVADVALRYGYGWGTLYDLGALAVEATGRLGARRRLLAGVGVSWALPPGNLDAVTGDAGSSGAGSIRVRQLETLALVGFQGEDAIMRGGAGGTARISARLELGIGVATLLGQNTFNGRDDQTAVFRATLDPAMAVWLTRGLSLDVGGRLEFSAPGVSVVGATTGDSRGVVSGGLRVGLRWTFVTPRERETSPR